MFLCKKNIFPIFSKKNPKKIIQFIFGLIFEIQIKRFIHILI